MNASLFLVWTLEVVDLPSFLFYRCLTTDAHRVWILLLYSWGALLTSSELPSSRPVPGPCSPLCPACCHVKVISDHSGSWFHFNLDPVLGSAAPAARSPASRECGQWRQAPVTEVTATTDNCYVKPVPLFLPRLSAIQREASWWWCNYQHSLRTRGKLFYLRENLSSLH